MGEKDSLQLGAASGANSGQNIKMILAQPDNFFPVKLILNEDPPLLGPQTYPDQTLQDADAQAIANALAFYKSINAQSGSALAKTFATATQNATANIDALTAASSAADKFFAATEQYKNVTYNLYTAVSTYLNTFPFAWANFQTSYAYNVYVADQQGTESVLLGSITFNRPDSNPQLTDTTGGYTITYAPSKLNEDNIFQSSILNTPASVPLYFKRGQLVSDLNADSPDIVLVCNFMNMSTFSGDPADFGNIVPALTGTIKGQDVLGIDASQPIKDALLTTIQSFLNSSGVQLFNSAANFMQSIEIGAKVVSWVYGKLFGAPKPKDGTSDPDPKPPTQSQVDSAVQSELKNADEELIYKDGLTPPSALSNTQSQLSQKVKTVNEDQAIQEAANAELDSIKKTITQLNDNTGGVQNSQIESIESNLRTDAASIKTAMQSAQTSSNPATLDQAKATVGSVQQDVVAQEKAVTNTVKSINESTMETIENESTTHANAAKEILEKEEGEGGSEEASPEGRPGEEGKSGLAGPREEEPAVKPHVGIEEI
ncbi:hypothetical protein A6A40_15235 (plasmid) [Azospirillum humicireducens]|uniref:Uncharacterized protein n=2 Tax=Azospirillum humicireducens TaxID=1226968 RepID=A0A2R4VPT9_9PROT|nr:hypothetical protein A6A40_15235 [Azospirillum humicireducens]